MRRIYVNVTDAQFEWLDARRKASGNNVATELRRLIDDKQQNEAFGEEKYKEVKAAVDARQAPVLVVQK